MRGSPAFPRQPGTHTEPKCKMCLLWAHVEPSSRCELPGKPSVSGVTLPGKTSFCHTEVCLEREFSFPCSLQENVWSKNGFLFCLCLDRTQPLVNAGGKTWCLGSCFILGWLGCFVLCEMFCCLGFFRHCFFLFQEINFSSSQISSVCSCLFSTSLVFSN